MFGGRKKKIADLLQRGEQALDNEQYDLVLTLGQELKKLGHPAAYKLMANGLRFKNRPDEAVLAVEEGLREHPDSWQLLEFKGEICTNLGLYDEADRAFAQLSRVPGIPAVRVAWHRAMLESRRDRPAEAIQLLHQWPDGTDFQSVAAHETRSECYAKLGLFQDALREAQLALSKASQGGFHPGEMGRFWACLARAQRGLHLPEAEQSARTAARLSPQYATVCQVLRDVQAKFSPSTRLWGMHVKVFQDGQDFSAIFECAADSADEAAEFIRDLLSQSGPASVKVMTATPGEAVSQEPQGVIRAVPSYLYAEG